MSERNGSVDPLEPLRIHGASVCLGARQTEQASVLIEEGCITSIENASEFPGTQSVVTNLDLSGFVLMPGLINAHDHLQFALYPRLGGKAYGNYVEWGEDIQKRCGGTVAQQHAIPRNVRLWWGALRNLLCGATTVCHHDQLWPELDRADFPVRVVQQYGWSHSVALGGDLQVARNATPPGRAFVLHACEGVDEFARRELFVLDRQGLLDSAAVLVHGLAIGDAGLELMERRGSALILCPSSNSYLFGEVPGRSHFCKVKRLALGSDSPLTACGDLLDEVRFAVRACALSPEQAYAMVTDLARAILRLEKGEGRILAGGYADLIGVRDTGCDAAERMATLSAADIELVMVGGRVHLASECMYGRLSAKAVRGLECLDIAGTVRWVRAPVSDMLRTAEMVLGKSNVFLGGRQVGIPASAPA